uniref:Mitogen-activated protein kinase n=1 Tax=Hofstenia miamia TaxID=442651 RepID=A0A8K1R2F6_HOFMI|nr:nlk [Hofstenia miamia]
MLNRSKEIVNNMSGRVAHLTDYHNHILSTAHHSHNSPAALYGPTSQPLNDNGDVSDKEDYQPDRPIGYGAFGVVWAVTDPRNGKRVALKKLPNAFSSTVAARRVFRELRMLFHFRHENILKAIDILQPPHISLFHEIYLICELMQSDLHKIIVSPQPISQDHVKIFIYQILRGLKYIHSSGVIHRDIKPGNLLVNSNCALKICDFGLARKLDPNTQVNMTREVVTQYYRAPELLALSRIYTSAIDIWSVGCIFGELLSRKILFQAPGPISQIDLIIDLLGTPSSADIRKYASDIASTYILKQPKKPSALSALYRLNSAASNEAIHLLSRLLVWNPDKRISVTDALNHPFLDEGRLRYHSCMCTCCVITPQGTRQHTNDFEPVCRVPFDDLYEDLTSSQAVKESIHKYIMDHQRNNSVPLCINSNSVAYKNFASSTVANAHEVSVSQVW